MTTKRILIVAGLILFLLLAGVIVLPARAQTVTDTHDFYGAALMNFNSGRAALERRLCQPDEYLQPAA